MEIEAVKSVVTITATAFSAEIGEWSYHGRVRKASNAPTSVSFGKENSATMLDGASEIRDMIELLSAILACVEERE